MITNFSVHQVCQKNTTCTNIILAGFELHAHYWRKVKMHANNWKSKGLIWLQQDLQLVIIPLDQCPSLKFASKASGQADYLNCQSKGKLRFHTSNLVGVCENSRIAKKKWACTADSTYHSCLASCLCRSVVYASAQRTI